MTISALGFLGFVFILAIIFKIFILIYFIFNSVFILILSPIFVNYMTINCHSIAGLLILFILKCCKTHEFHYYRQINT